MNEGAKKLELTLKVSDRLVKLSMIVSNYSENGINRTVKLYRDWVNDTERLLRTEFDPHSAEEFKNREQSKGLPITPQAIDEYSKEHADFLQALIKGIIEPNQ